MSALLFIQTAIRGQKPHDSFSVFYLDCCILRNVAVSATVEVPQSIHAFKDKCECLSPFIFAPMLLLVDTVHCRAISYARV